MRGQIYCVRYFRALGSFTVFGRLIDGIGVSVARMTLKVQERHEFRFVG